MTEMRFSVEVRQPLDVTFRCFTWFEVYPEFAKSIERVRRDSEVGDSGDSDDGGDSDVVTVHWIVSLASLVRDSTAVFDVNQREYRVSWRSTAGPDYAGEATMTETETGHTRISVMVGFRPHGVAEKLGDRLGVIRRRFAKDLRRFASYVESGGVGTPTGRRVAETPFDDRPRSYEEKITDWVTGEEPPSDR